MGYREVVLATPGLVTYHRMGGGGSEASIGPDAAVMTHAGGPATVAGLIRRGGDGAKRYDGGTTMGSSFSTAAFSGAATMSLECWFREDAPVEWGHIFENDDWPTCRFQILRSALNPWLSIGWRDGVGGADYGPGFVPYTPLTVTHVVVTADGSAIRAYINGVLRATAGMAGVFGTGSRVFRVSRIGSQALQGVVDEVATYGVALSAAVVAGHYAAGRRAGVLNGVLVPV